MFPKMIQPPPIISMSDGYIVRFKLSTWKVKTHFGSLLLCSYNFATRQAAENVLDVLKHRFGWIGYIEQDASKWRVKTGTFTGATVAQAGANKIKTAKLAQVTISAC